MQRINRENNYGQRKFISLRMGKAACSISKTSGSSVKEKMVMNIDGWAFKPNELELRDKNTARFKEIEHLKSKLNLTKNPAYGMCKFYGQLEGEEALALSPFDIALIADGGNLCFGGSCTKSSDGRFSGTYNTD